MRTQMFKGQAAYYPVEEEGRVTVSVVKIHIIEKSFIKI